jgi:hypothetical protein
MAYALQIMVSAAGVNVNCWGEQHSIIDHSMYCSFNNDFFYPKDVDVGIDLSKYNDVKISAVSTIQQYVTDYKEVCENIATKNNTIKVCSQQPSGRHLEDFQVKTPLALSKMASRNNAVVPFSSRETKTFFIEWKTPIEEEKGGWGSSGVWSINPTNWWNNSWSFRANISNVDNETTLLLYPSNMSGAYENTTRIVDTACGNSGGNEVPFDIDNYAINASGKYENLSLFFLGKENVTYCLYWDDTFQGNPNYGSKVNMTLTNGTNVAIENNLMNFTVADFYTDAYMKSAFYYSGNASTNLIVNNQGDFLSIIPTADTMFRNGGDTKCDIISNKTVRKILHCNDSSMGGDMFITAYANRSYMDMAFFRNATETKTYSIETYLAYHDRNVNHVEFIYGNATPPEVHGASYEINGYVANLSKFYIATANNDTRGEQYFVILNSSSYPGLYNITWVFETTEGYSYIYPGNNGTSTQRGIDGNASLRIGFITDNSIQYYSNIQAEAGYYNTRANTAISSPEVRMGILLFSPANITYHDLSIPLLVDNNTQISTWKYELDGASNISFTPNATLFLPFGTHSGQHNISVYANTTSGDWSHDSSVFSVKLFETNESYDTTTYEGVTSDFLLEFNVTNMTAINSITASLFWNGSNVSYTTKTLGANSYVFKKSYLIPFISQNETSVAFNWSYIVTYADGGNTTNQTTNRNQTITEANINNCSGGTGMVALKFNLLEEENKTAITGSIGATFEVVGSGANFSFNMNGSNTYNVCIEPNYTSYVVNATMQYTAEGYSTRNYYLTNYRIDNITDTINLYLLLSGDSTTITFLVYDNYRIPQKDIVVKAQRYFPNTNEYLTVAMGKTGFDGVTAMPLKYNYYYKFILERGGSVLNAYTPKILSETSEILFIEAAEMVDLFEYFGSVAHSCIYNNATQNLVCTVTDTSGKMVQLNLDVEIKKAFNYTENICSMSSTSSSTTLVCSLAGHTNQTIYYALYGRFCCSETSYFTLESAWLDFTTKMFNFGLLGVFIALLLIITMAFFGWDPVTRVLFGFLGALISHIFGLLPIEFGGVLSLAAVTAIIIYKVKS